MPPPSAPSSPREWRRAAPAAPSRGGRSRVAPALLAALAGGLLALAFMLTRVVFETGRYPMAPILVSVLAGALGAVVAPLSWRRFDLGDRRALYAALGFGALVLTTLAWAFAWALWAYLGVG